MKIKWWIITLAVAVTFSLAWLIWRIGTKKISPEEFVMTLRPTAVMVTAGEMHASGVIFDITDEEVKIVTTGHLLDGYDQGIITFHNGSSGFGNVERISQNPDVCIMSFKTEYIDAALLKELSKAPNDEKHYEDLKVGDKVYLVGSALSTGSNAVEGSVAAKDFYVEEFDADMLYLYTDVMAGMSGCGVYDDSGYLVGILAGGNEIGEAVCVSLPQIYETEELSDDKN